MDKTINNLMQYIKKKFPQNEIGSILETSDSYIFRLTDKKGKELLDSLYEVSKKDKKIKPFSVYLNNKKFKEGLKHIIYKSN